MEGFSGAQVFAFESRRAREMESILASQGADPVVAPSMREAPLEENPAAWSFAEELLQGRLQVVVFLTGVGCRTLFEVLETRYDRSRLTAALGSATVVARGPKAVKALRDLGAPMDLAVPEPNTWRDVVASLEAYRLERAVGPAPSPSDARPARPFDGLRIAIQEYGVTNDDLVKALEERGAEVLRVPVYRWALPEDLGPMRQAIQRIQEAPRPIVLFTNANQVCNLLQVAREMGSEAPLRQALGRGVVASIGPTCTEMLRSLGLPVTVEPEHPRMGYLARAAARAAQGMVEGRPAYTVEGAGAEPAPRRPAWYDSPFLRACRREPVPYTPVWLMRQAGRYMKEYREVRQRCSFLELCKSPDLVAEVTVTAQERIGADAAILFADILLVTEPMGLTLEFNKGEGPSIRPAVRTGTDVDRLHEVDPGALQYVYDAVERTRADLKPDIPLIGFSGAPFTVASYIIEGGSSRDFAHTRGLMYQDPGAWHALQALVSRALAGYLKRQIEAGAQAVQLFDSWVGCVAVEDYRDLVLPHVRSVIQALPEGVPVIYFGTGTWHLLDLIRDAGSSVIGLDWRQPLDEGWRRVGWDRAIQGNLDSVALLTDLPTIRRKAKQVLDQAAGRPGHVFNLGHGILPQTPVDHVIGLIDAVHEMSGGDHGG